VFSISIAMSEKDDYEGGYFHLQTDHALFKVDRRSAIVFFSETDHSITEIVNGQRQVFVVEVWQDDDAPVGLARPSPEQFEAHKAKRRRFVSALDEL
jgi:hypothetical protein